MFKKSYEITVNSNYYGKYSFVVQADSIADALEVARKNNLFQPLDNEKDVCSCKEIEETKEEIEKETKEKSYESIPSFENTTSFDKPVTLSDVLKDIQISTIPTSKNKDTNVQEDTQEQCGKEEPVICEEYYETEEDYKIYEQIEKPLSHKIAKCICFITIGYMGYFFVKNFIDIISFFN